MTAAWAIEYLAARELIRTGEQQQRDALRARCVVVDSGAAQCTADAQPEHEHRWRRDDLPGYDPTD